MHVVWFVCGLITSISVATPDGSINIKKHPYILELLYNRKHWCGAVLISTRIVLSTAYCTYKVPKTNLTIIAGSSIPENLYVNQYKIFSIYTHKKYDPSEPGYDVSVIFPLVPIESHGKYVMPIHVAEMHYIPGTEVMVSGWKSIKERVVLLSAKLKLKGARTCRADYKKLNITVTEGELCAFGDDEAVCRSDPGGALVIGNRLVGLVSKIFYPTCMQYPGIYTSFYHFKPFIKSTVKKVLSTKKSGKKKTSSKKRQ